MKIAIFGATGRTGLLTVYQALDKGHAVTAFARNPAMVKITHKNITIVKGDILEYAKVKEAVNGQDVIISALGVESRKPTTMLSEGTKNILQAMEECKVNRFICMSSAGILGNDAGFIFGKIIIPLLLKEVFKDKIRQMNIIQESKAEWVIVRPSGLTDSPKTGRYKVSMDSPRSRTVPRADVADFMLKLTTDKQYDRKMPAISS
jgi:putative NADH-flavin reductase